MPVNNAPQITIWNRLEPRPRRKEFGRSLRSEVRDSLWFLTRQWQFGEFKGEDTGTAVHVRVDMETSRLKKICLHEQAVKNFDNATPLEMQVEKFAFTPDVTLQNEMGRHLLRLLKKALEDAGVNPGDVSAALADLKSNAALHFILPAMDQNHGEFYGNLPLWQTYATLINGRGINGWTVYLHLKDNTTNAVNDFYGTTHPLAVVTVTQSIGATFIQWFESTYNYPQDNNDSAWDAAHLEYNFMGSVPATPSANSYLTADEYYSGKLDWYNFDFESKLTGNENDLKEFAGNGSYIRREVKTIMPRDLSFPGMPRPRWWEFEDSKVDFGKINTHTTDIGALLFLEFALIYSNDWMVIPWAVDAGSLCQIKSMVVKDSFGQLTLINAAGAGSAGDWQRWTMFNLHRRNSKALTADTRLFVPPTSGKMLEGEAIESVNFMRDEMANMVWGVETIVPDELGAGRKGVEAATRLRDYLRTVAGPVLPTVISPNDANIRFQLATEVPENWIPFIPVHKTSGSRQIQLQRAAMPRIMDGITLARVRPRTDLLRVGIDTVNNTVTGYRIHEEEVPRSGAIVHSNWQRTRWYDGSNVTWLGRRKTNGRGEGNSGLRYDQILPK